MRSDDAAAVREQHATEHGHAARASIARGTRADAHHVPDLDRGLAERARVLRPGGSPVVVTNAAADLGERWHVGGRDTPERLSTFRAENGEEASRRHFHGVVGHDVASDVTFADARDVRCHGGSSIAGKDYVDDVPELDEPFVAHKLVTAFVATKGSLQQTVASVA